MALNDYLTRQRITILKGKTKKGAISELVRVAAKELPGVDRETLAQAIWDREALLTTRITPEIAIPHARIDSLDRSLIVVGKSPEGIVYDRMDPTRVRLIFLIIGGSADHLRALGAVASLLQHKALCERCLAIQDREELYALLVAGQIPGDVAPPVTEAVCDQALRLADRIGAQVVIIHHAPPSIRSVLAGLADPPRLIFTGRPPWPPEDAPITACYMDVPFRGLGRSSHLELSLLLALSKGFVHKGEMVVSAYGTVTDMVDTIVVTDLNREFKVFFSVPIEPAAEQIEQQVFIRVLQLATELADEGREGKPVGTLFVVGDSRKVKQHCQHLIINPFKGYSEHEKNILDPGLSETIKEFAHIDGAFVIRDDGVIEAAGVYLRVDHPVDDLPSGLGARHTAAAAITAISRSIAVAVSESTRAVSIFRSGQRIMEI